MKKLSLIAFTILLSSAVFHSCNEPIVNEPTSDELTLKSADVKKSYIVVLNDAELNAELALQSGYQGKQKSANSAAEKILKRAGITDGLVEHVYGSAIKGFSVKIPPGQLKKLQDDPSVQYIEEDQVVTLVIPDVKINGKPGGGGGTPAQTTPWGITRVKGGLTYTGTNVAWIIDTGIDLTHPDLVVDKTRGKNFVSTTSAPNDDNGHGTHCAGIVAAKNNTIGVIGVAAGATVVPIKVLNRQGSGTYSAIIAGVDYVKANGKAGDVANMSLGGGFSQALNDAVIAASVNVKFSLAAGNESTSATTKSPASAEGANIYTISAMDNNDKWAYFSNYGNPPIEFCEPGVSIYSCYKGGSYATMSGTSMAAPHAAGLLLLGIINNGGAVIGDPGAPSDIIGVH
jgi:subtilisin family serine protease